MQSWARVSPPRAHRTQPNTATPSHRTRRWPTRHPSKESPQNREFRLVSPDQAESITEVLRQSVFAVLADKDLHALATQARCKTLPAAQLIYDPEVSVVASGLLRAFIADGTGRQLTIAYLGPGDGLALAHLAGRRYPTAFQAIVDSNILVVGNERTRHLQHTFPALGWRIAQELAVRMDDLEEEIARIGFGTLRHRLAYHLLTLTADAPQLPVHLIRLATAVGSPREVVSRTLSPLVDDGAIRLNSSGITVTDRQRLQEHARLP